MELAKNTNDVGFVCTAVKRLFIGTCDFGFLWGDISEALALQGYEVIYLGGCSHPSYAYRYKKSNVLLVDLIEKLYRLRNSTGRFCMYNFPQKILAVFGASLLKILLFLKLLVTRTDGYIFVAGSSLLPLQLDLRILKFIKKPVIAFIGHGGDSRPPYLSGRDVPNGHFREEELSEMYVKSQKLSKLVARACMARYVICNPFHSQFLTKPFLSVFQFFECAAFDITAELRELRRANFGRQLPVQFTHKRPLRIIHTYSAPEAKGTDYIEQVLKSIANSGQPISYEILGGLSHMEVVRYRARADLVIDQMYSDAPLASAATESLAVGVPVIVAGYEMPTMKDLLNSIPGIFILPENLETTIINILRNPSIISQEKIKISTWLERNFLEESARRIIEIFLKPEKFSYLDPRTLGYFHGMGVSENRLRYFLRAYINKYGVYGLFAGDKKVFLRELLTFLDSSFFEDSLKELLKNSHDSRI